MMIGGSFVFFSYFDFARFNGNTVVAYAEFAADYVNVIAGFRVKSVRIGTVFGSVYGHVQEIEIMGKIRVKLP